MAETLETIKKYTGPFSGSQMDQIFYEILNYTSERYAKGTANGQAVAAGTIGYNDNAYYYSRQALQSAQAAANAADRAEAAVPAGIDSAVLFTRAQTLTADQQAQARANIAAGGSNYNYLKNWRFGSTKINQKGATSFVSGQMGIDCWKGGSTMAGVTISSSDLVFTAGGLSNIAQSLGTPFIEAASGLSFTASVLLSDGTLYKGTATIQQGQIVIFFNNSELRCFISAAGNFNIQAEASNTGVRVKAAKLEKGIYSTLINDLTSDSTLELLKCQKYFVRLKGHPSSSYPIAFGYASSATTCRLFFPLPTTLNRIPTISTGGRWQIEGDGTTHTITAWGTQPQLSNNGLFEGLTSSGLTVGHIYSLVNATVNAYIDIDAMD